MSTTRKPLGFALATTLGALAFESALAAAQPLRRDLGSYFVFAMRNASLKNLDLLSACNVGVNCARPSSNSSCGVSTVENSFFADGSQLAADVTRFNRGGASVFQLFSNLMPNTSNVTVRQPGSGPGGATPFTLPIIGDLDGDGRASCSAGCVPDYGDIAVFCGLPSQAPVCDVTRPVLVRTGEDCTGGVDSQPGNARCDLPAGVYGSLTVQNGAAISYDGGTYAFCSVGMGRNVNAVVKDAATLNVTGDFNVNNGSTFGQQCGDINVNAFGPGAVGFGRNSSVTGFFCAPERTVNLGHNNDLTGRFVGDVVNADSNNRGRCCGSACACVDEVTPRTASVGASVTLTGGCSLANVTGVRICGHTAPIGFRSTDEIVVTVPAGAAGACTVEVDSGAGTFTLLSTLTVP